jgi:hypothetical protein
MQHRPVSGIQCPQRRRRRKKRGGVQRISGFMISVERPQQRPTPRDQITLIARAHHRSIGQGFDRLQKRMQSLHSPIQPLTMQHPVDIRRAGVCDAVAPLPRRAKTIGVVAAAIEARAMPRSERRRLVQKKQFGPASRAHHVAAAAAEFADAGDPRLAAPAPVQQRFRGGIVDDAAIAGEQAALRGCDDLAGWRDAVLQGRSQITPRRRGSAAGTPARCPTERKSRCPATPR